MATTSGTGLSDVLRNARGLYQRTRTSLRFGWPVYDVWRFFANKEARRLFEQERARTAPTPAEQSVIDELRRNGIAIVQLSDLLPGAVFEEIKRWGESLISTPAMRERIKAIEGGARPDVKGGKYYIVRPLGPVPAFDVRDHAIQATLSGPMLRIVNGYLGLFSRVAALDLWYNIAVEGPDQFSQRWHRDPEDRALIKTFLYLHDCDEANGPFCYVPGTHDAGPFQQKIGRYNYPDEGVIESRFTPEQRKVCTGKAGTLVFCDTSGFHKGGHAKSGARFLFNAVYTTNASEPVARRTRQCTLAGPRTGLDPAASYAVGLIAER